MGIIDENGAMVDDFNVGDIDAKTANEMLSNLTRKEDEERENERKEVRVRVVEKYKVCDQSMREIIPCLDNVDAIRRLNSSENGEKFERHCAEKDKGLDCLVPAPNGYQSPIPWPQSLHQVIIPYTVHVRTPNTTFFFFYLILNFILFGALNKKSARIMLCSFELN